jgi:RNA polymerase sigma-70 factor (ECF subfamily)
MTIVYLKQSPLSGNVMRLTLRLWRFGRGLALIPYRMYRALHLCRPGGCHYRANGVSWRSPRVVATDNRPFQATLRSKGTRLVWSTSNPKSLIQRCNRGDKRAWEELYARYSGAVSRTVGKLGSGDPQETEDLVQEVFLHLFKALRKYDPSRPIEAYILEIARRVRISRYRRNSAAKRGGREHATMPLDAHDGGEAGYIMIPSPEGDQEAALIKAQQTSLLRKALKMLSENCRKLLAMRYHKELSYKELATEFSAKEGTLRVRVQRCLSALARHHGELLQEQEGGP